jgi:peptide/nickel transport system ATP-binding protein
MLSVTNLAIQFKTTDGLFDAVKGISFQLAKGETIGIVGESGSGKSVTSLSLMRLLDKSSSVVSGKVMLDDIDMFGISEEEMRAVRGNRIAMIFQEPMTSLNPVLTCGYQVTEAIQLHLGLTAAEAKAQAIKLFKEVQLPRPEAIFDSYPHQVSGGQKQRVMIAMALSCDPEILIADEPTTALDVTVQKTIIDLLKKLKGERGMSLVFISHDLGVVHEIADRVLVMYKGEIIEQEKAAKLFAHPQHPYTKGLLACRPSVKHHLKRLPVIADFKDSDTSIAEIRKEYNYPKAELVERKKRLYSQQPLLEVKDLSTWFPVSSSIFGQSKNMVKAVNKVSFDVYPGETLGLVGESGCGKTTLGRSILRLIEPSALALQPKFIICDESVSALDVSVQAQVLNLIRELQQEFNLTYIFISHDLSVIKHISDRMMVMNKGEIIEIGDPDDIYNHPKEEYTKRLIDSIPQF